MAATFDFENATIQFKHKIKAAGLLGDGKKQSVCGGRGLSVRV